MGYLYQDTSFEPVPWLVFLLRQPFVFLAHHIYYAVVASRREPAFEDPAIRLVCISDSHAKTKLVPDGDVLVHAGDLTNAGTIDDIQAQIDWLDHLPHQYKVCIAGNHDTFLDPSSRKYLQSDETGSSHVDWKSVKYLQHSALTLPFPGKANRRLKIYGAPQIPACGGREFAFQYEHDTDVWRHTIPPDLDVLVTHTPPAFHRDLSTGRGCRYLLEEIWHRRPRVHVCGHVHAGQGREALYWDSVQKTYEDINIESQTSLYDLLNPTMYLLLIKLTFDGIVCMLRSLLPGSTGRTTLLVNASLTYRNTGRLDNDAEIVLL